MKQWLQRKARDFLGIGKRGFHGAESTRLTLDWITSNASADAEIKGDVKTLRNRCRELCRRDPWAVRYLNLVENNVLGARGIGLEMKIRERVRLPKGQVVDKYDDLANQQIEEAWARWGKAENCTIGGNLSWGDVQRLVVRSVPRDGAILIRKHKSKVNPFGFALEPIEIDHLDTDADGVLAGGGEIRLGVEYSPVGRPVAYHLKSEHPGALNGNYHNWKKDRVSASDMLHIFRPERVGQSTGYPWMASVMQRLNHLDRYEEAEVVASRAAAAKMILFERTAGTGYTGESAPGGGTFMEMSPGMGEELPFGLKPHVVDPTHPNTAFDAFIKASLRGVASGLGVSYNSLANDLEGVNYSSIRAGLLEEREEWRRIQRWLIDWLARPVFDDWLMQSMLFGAISLPLSKYEKFNQPEWKPRAWPWVDPLKDQQANVLAIQNKLRSRREIIAETGGDIENTYADLSADQALEASYGLKSEIPQPTNNNNNSVDKESKENGKED